MRRKPRKRRRILLRVTDGWPKYAHAKRGPFVYRLGHQVFNLGRGVRLPYGLPLNSVSLTIPCPPAIGTSDRSCRIAHHAGTWSNVARNNCPGTDDGSIPHGYARQKDRAATDPDILTNVHRQCSLKAIAPTFRLVSMIRAIDMD